MGSAVICPQCEQRIDIGPQMYGTTILCPLCKASLTIEAPNSPPTSAPVNPAARPVTSPQSSPPLPAQAPVRYPARQFSKHPGSTQDLPPVHQNQDGQLGWVLGIFGCGCLVVVVVLAVGGYLLVSQMNRLDPARDIADAQAVETSDPPSQPRRTDTQARTKQPGLLEARKGFQTRITHQLQMNEGIDQPPRDLFQLVQYPSSVGPLAAYVSQPTTDAKKLPAIIWVFGGFSNGIGDTAWLPQVENNDQSASVYRKQGIVMMYPSLRGGNDNPGHLESFYGEVDDVLAAADYLAQQDFVDPDRIYLGGHSTGGTLVMLCAASSDKFRAVFALGPVGDISGYGEMNLLFDVNDKRELELRNPIEWLAAIKVPVFAIEGIDGNSRSLRTMKVFNNNPKVKMFVVPGADHFSVIGPVNKLLSKKILQDTGPECQIKISQRELESQF